MVNKEPPD